MQDSHITINDCYINVRGDMPTRIEVLHIEGVMPFFINHLAEMWGWHDTVVKDEVMRFIERLYRGK